MERPTFRTFAEGVKVAEDLYESSQKDPLLQINVKCKQRLIKIWFNPHENPRRNDE